MKLCQLGWNGRYPPMEDVILEFQGLRAKTLPVIQGVRFLSQTELIQAITRIENIWRNVKV